MTEEELLKEAESMELDEWQMIQVKLGLKILPESSIKIYMDKAFSHRQMEQIRIALMDGIEPKIIKKAMKPEIGYEGMQQVRMRELQNVQIGHILQSVQKIKDDLTQYVADYSDRERTIAQLEGKLKEQEAAVDSQRETITQYEAALQRLQSQNQKTVHDEQKIWKWIPNGKKRDTLIQRVQKQKFNAEQIEEIRLSLEDGLTEEQLMKLSEPNIEAEKMHQLRLFYKAVNTKNGFTVPEKKEAEDNIPDVNFIPEDVLTEEA